MGINVYPSGSPGFTLRRVITTTQNVEFGQPKKIFLMLAGGGGGGARTNQGTNIGGGGGGGMGGVIAGSMMAQWLGIQIGAGGAATTGTSGSPGNDGSPSYVAQPNNNHSNNTAYTRNNTKYIVACGGQGGFNTTSSQGTGNLTFPNATAPVMSGINSFWRTFGCAGTPGGGGSGAGFSTMIAQTQNIENEDVLANLYGWDHNLVAWYVNFNTSNTTIRNYYNTFTDPTNRTPYDWNTASGQTTYSGPRTIWTTQQASGSFCPGGNGGSGANGDFGASGKYIGAGGGGGGSGTTGGGAGGGGMFYQGGLGGYNPAAAGGQGGGGGGGLYGAGTDGSQNNGVTGGNGGSGGLGGGGGGGTGGNQSGSGSKTGGKGGDGVCLIFW